MDSRIASATLAAVIAFGITACGDEDPVIEAQAAALTAGNSAPVIQGEPDVTVMAGEAYDFRPVASDPDGDPIIFGIDGLPGWLAFNATTGRLTGTPQPGDVGMHRGIVVWVSDGRDETLLPTLDIEVLPASAANNQPPVISGSPVSTTIAGQFYDFIPTVSDGDGDTLSFQIENRPGWASFDPAIGRLSGTPGSGAVGVYSNIVIRVSDGIDSATLGPFVIAVNPPPAQNRAPIITGVPDPDVLVGQAWAFQPQASDPDGDSLSFEIFNAPSWMSLNVQTGLVSGTPAPGEQGVYGGITLVVSDGQAATSLPAFSVEAISVNAPPVISGNPSTSVSANQAYSFVPTATDPDGDALSFSIANPPSWASFDTGTGALSGTPDAGDVNLYSAISITVDDGEATDTLGPFSINVVDNNASPVISGNPSTQALVGQAYSFAPTASDPDGDTLVFTIVNPPSWASFDPDTGALSGTPSAGNVGLYASISITVDDGEMTDTLGPFSVNVTAVANGTALLSWMPPTENMDGSPLTDLAGFIVYWGTDPGNYSNTEIIADAGVTTFVVQNLLSGSTYFFTTTAYNSQDLESTSSNVASKTIP